MELLLGADDEVEEVQRRLQLAGNLGALDEAALALAVAGDAPQVGAVVDVERGAGAVLAGEGEGLRTAAAVRGWLRWVPVASTARASAMKPSSMSASVSPMSAQFSR